ncbi:MAG: efflux RND transporter permease subunit, partial [Bacteroidota bacterium]
MKYGFKWVVVFIVLAILGIAVIPLLNVDLNPQPNDFSFTIRYTLPESSPQQVEHEATSPLENVFSQLSGLSKVYSISNYGRGAIELTFQKDVDLDFKRFEISALLRQVYPKLNQKLSYPTIAVGNRETDHPPLAVYQIKSTLPKEEAYRLVKQDVVTALSQIKGIDEVSVDGAQGQQITINLDGVRLRHFGITAKQLTEVLRKRFLTVYPGTQLLSSGQYLTLQVGESLNSLKQLKKIIIGQHEGQAIRLSHLGNVYLEGSEPSRYFRVDGQNTLVLTLSAEEDQNRIRLMDQIENKLGAIKVSLPNGFEIIKDYDDTEYLRTELSKIYQRAGFSILILSLFIFMINRNLKYLFVLFSGILLTICLTSLCAWFLSIDIHIYSIAGLTIAFGLVVDNSIVMLDHLHKKNNLQVFKALLGASLTTIAAVLLVFFLPEEQKKDLFEFGQIIAVSLFLSLLVALFYTPALFNLLNIGTPANKRKKLRKWHAKFFRGYEQFIYILAKRRKWVVMVLVISFGLPVFMLPTQWKGHDWYNATIGSELYQESIRPYSDRVFGGALRLFVRNVFEKSGYRTPDKTRLYVNASMPYGSTIHQLNEILTKVESYLHGVNGISKFVTRVSSGQQGNITIEFEPDYENGALPYQLKSRLIARSLDWGGVEWNIYGVGRGFSNAGSDQLPAFRVLMKGYNYDELEAQSNQLAERLLAHKRIQKVNTNERLSWSEESRKEYLWKPNLYALAQSDVSSLLIMEQLDFLSKRTEPSFFIPFSNINMPVYVKENESDRFSIFNLKNQQLQIDSVLLDLNQSGKLELTQTVNAIHKENRQYLRVLGFEYFGSYKFGNKYLDETLAIQKKEMPLGYSTEKLTWQWNWGRVKRQYGLLIILVIAIYFICSILFENLKQPLFIIFCIPISLIGLFLTFALFDFYFDQGGYAAFVLLGGLVVNAAIFVVNDLNNLKKGKYNRNILKAVAHKAQPIMLTILSTCFGL